MKYAIPYFSYKNFSNFKKIRNREGHYSVNLGDYQQSLAIRNLYQQLGIPDEDIIAIDRDDLANYKGESAVFIMNGCYYPHCFPISKNIIPVFIGISIAEKSPYTIDTEKTISSNIDYFKKHEPIGCRDERSKRLFEKHGIKAYVTGCLTLTHPERPTSLEKGKVMFVYGAPSVLSPDLLSLLPEEYFSDLELICHRKIVHEFPLSFEEMKNTEGYAKYLLNRWATQARLVITPLHHVAAPCISLGIPTIVCRSVYSPRFSVLNKITPIYTPPSFSNIDWAPEAIDITEFRNRLLRVTKHAIHSALDKYHSRT